MLFRSGRLCAGPSPESCGFCLPLQDSSDFLLRDGLMRALQRSVDVFVAPSQFLADWFRSWAGEGVDVAVIPNCPPPLIAIEQGGVDLPEEMLPCRFGFFGNPSAFSKGLDLVLEAFLVLVTTRLEAQLLIAGHLLKPDAARSHLEYQHLIRMQELLEKLGPAVQLLGGYQQRDVVRLMTSVHWVVMGSRWFENAPVVIEEAKHCRRPLLVPGHGGMEELVLHGRDGWHFRAGDSADLADQIGRAHV